MAAESFELRNVEWTLPWAALVVLSFVSAAVLLTLATTTGNHTFAVLALGLLAGFVVFFTNLWSPALHLVGEDVKRTRTPPARRGRGRCCI